MSAPFFGCNALWLNSNPRASVLELVIPFRDHLDESGAVRSSCSDNNAAQIRPWKRSSQTQRSRQLSQPCTKNRREISWRDWHNWKKKERTRKETTVKLKERSQTHTELTTLAKPKVSTREPRDWKWSFIFEAYNEAGSTQIAHNLKEIQDGGTTPWLVQLNEREKQLRANHDYMLTMLTCGKTLALVQLA